MAEHLWLRHPDGSPTEAMDGYEERLRAGSHVLCGGRVLLRLTRLERLCRRLWARLPVPVPSEGGALQAACHLVDLGHVTVESSHLVRRAPIPGDLWAHSTRVLVVDYIARHGPGVPMLELVEHMRDRSPGAHRAVPTTVYTLRHDGVLALDAEGLSVVRGGG